MFIVLACCWLFEIIGRRRKMDIKLAESQSGFQYGFGKNVILDNWGS